MPKKIAILNNVTEYSPADLASYIQQGIVTLDELCNSTDGDFTAKMKLDVEEILAGSEDADFKRVMKSESIYDLQEFLNKYPMGKPEYLEAVRIKKDKLEAKPIYEVPPIAPEFEDDSDENEWINIKNSDDINLFLQFKEKYPNSKYTFEVNKAITQIKNSEATQKKSTAILKALIQQANSADEVSRTIVKLVRNETISIQTLIDLISKDHNLLSSAACCNIIEQGILSRTDLSKCGIADDFINKMLGKAPSITFDPARPLFSIAEPCTEVYFWGIPSSGKTCALGAILSTAKSGLNSRSMIPDNNCQGFGYMNRLSSVFSSGKVCRLPGGTPVASTYEMRFELEDQENAIHDLACIDLAGELFTCMFMKDAGEELREDQEQALGTLHNILLNNRSNNRKIHFFVVEYGAENRIYNGLPQSEYLNSAAVHLNNMGLFNDNTDAIYVLISKVDKAKYEGSLDQHLMKYMTKNYLGFYNNLLRIAKENNINRGKISIVPFTIGDVCFKDYCRFDTSSASKMVELLMHYSYTRRKGFFNKIFDLFR